VFVGHIRRCKRVGRPLFRKVDMFGEPHVDALLCLRAENVYVIVVHIWRRRCVGGLIRRLFGGQHLVMSMLSRSTFRELILLASMIYGDVDVFGVIFGYLNILIVHI
jgi:hypothetical protein